MTSDELDQMRYLQAVADDLRTQLNKMRLEVQSLKDENRVLKMRALFEELKSEGHILLDASAL